MYISSSWFRSMPVWRYPITGFDRNTVSPSSSSITRSTPCVDGCWGPMLMIMVSSSVSSRSKSLVSMVRPSGRRRTAPSSRRNSGSVVDSRTRSSWLPSDVPIRCSWVSFVVTRSPRAHRVLELHGHAAHGVVLPQGMPFPVLGHEDAREVGMVVEGDAHHVERFPLHGL